MDYYKNLSEEQNRLNLKSEKVELGMVDDFKKLRKSGGKSYTNYVDDMDAAKGFLSKAIASAKAAKKDLDKAAKLHTDIESSAKDLGIKLPKEVANDTVRALAEETDKDLKMLTSVFSKLKVR